MQGRPLSQRVWKSGKHFLKQVKLFPFLRFRGKRSWKQMFYVLIFSLSELTNVLCFNFSFLKSGLILSKKLYFIITKQKYIFETDQSEKIRDDKNGNNFLGRIAEVLEVLWMWISLVCEIHLWGRKNNIL